MERFVSYSVAQRLFEAVGAVLDAKELSLLPYEVRLLLSEARSAACAAMALRADYARFVERAKRYEPPFGLKFDDFPALLISGDGVWVSAWALVPFEVPPPPPPATGLVAELIESLTEMIRAELGGISPDLFVAIYGKERTDRVVKALHALARAKGKSTFGNDWMGALD